MTRKKQEAAPMKLLYTKSRVFEAAVVSTMSSGKSTLINSFIGKNLLPSRNQACTARTTAVLDNDFMQTIAGHVLFSDGQYEKIQNCSADQISECLEGKGGGLADIIIECSIPGIRNFGQAILITDTPGVNNNADPTHARITEAHIDEMSSGLIIYVLNAAQMGTRDDFALLRIVKQVLDRNAKLEIIFVLNKADEIDSEKEPLPQLMQNCIGYLRDAGFPEANVLPASSLAALLFKKALHGDTMSAKELSSFSRFYNQFSSSDYRLSLYGMSGSDQNCTVGKRRYLRRKLLAALENTGLPAVERAIEDCMIRQLEPRQPTVKSPLITKNIGRDRAQGRKPMKKAAPKQIEKGRSGK